MQWRGIADNASARAYYTAAGYAVLRGRRGRPARRWEDALRAAWGDRWWLCYMHATSVADCLSRETSIAGPWRPLLQNSEGNRA